MTLFEQAIEVVQVAHVTKAPIAHASFATVLFASEDVQIQASENTEECCLMNGYTTVCMMRGFLVYMPFTIYRWLQTVQLPITVYRCEVGIFQLTITGYRWEVGTFMDSFVPICPVY